MSGFLSSLPEVGPSATLKLEKLPPLRSAFRIPRLEEKPQNPILETIRSNRKTSLHVLPKELIVLSNQISQSLNLQDEEVEDIWTHASKQEPLYKNRIVSWDTLRSTYEHPSTTSPFITEQPPHIVAAARHRAYPRLFSPNDKLKYLSAQDLIECLNSTLIGCSSRLHSWDTLKSCFVATTEDEENQVRIIVDGMDEVVSDSYLERFLTIGTLLRRLDERVQELRISSRALNSTTFGFGHVLSMVLIWIREEASRTSAAVLKRGLSRVVDFWLAFEEIEQTMRALSSLCLCDIHLSLTAYGALPTEPSQLLSHIYKLLLTNIEQQSPKTVVALLSYILTITSGPYFQSLAQSVGFEGLEHTIEAARNRARRVRYQSDADLYGADEIEQVDDGDLDLESEDTNAEEYPSFMTEELREAVIRARRSIKILSAPELDDVSLGDMSRKKLEWVWTEQDVIAFTLGHDLNSQAIDSNTPRVSGSSSPIPQVPGSKYRPELANLALFDLEPGTGVSYSEKRSTARSQVPNSLLSTFLSTYPSYLPSITPTLPLLTDLVFSPVKEQAALLSRASLRLFMDPSSALHLRAHLVLLRGYLLLTAHAFRTRLSAALFSDQDAHIDEDGSAQPAVPTRRDKAGDQNREETTHWAVGLSPKLIEKAQGQWPPYDSDLAFILRRVIMDSLELVRNAEPANLGVDGIWNEAESKIGFATRPLPSGKGREKEIDPENIEALDFLYMIYKPPRPLTCLITEDILLKYRRVFSFLLRLLRAENVMRILFRLTRTRSEDIFPYSSQAQNVLVQFRFAAQSFLTSFTSYVYDTAIGGNFDAFLARISSAESSPDFSAENYFTDVFSLMQRHSRVLDDILSACLLRTVQKVLREVLEEVLASIVAFGVLIGNVRNGHIEASTGAVRLEELFGLFKEKRNLLMKALHRIVDKTSSTPGLDTENNQAGRTREQSFAVAPGGMGALAILLDQLTGMRGK